MRLGIYAYRTQTGLGYQCRDYYKWLNPHKVLVIDLNGLNGVPLTDWYPEAQTVKGYPRPHELREFLSGLDVVLLAETPLNYDFYTIAKEMGVKTAAVPNMEFFDHSVHPEYETPDLFIVPSMWKYDECEAFATERGVKIVQLHHPVDRDIFPFRQRTTPKPLHIAGKPAAYDRNGTWDYMEAVPDGTLVTQNEFFARQIRAKYRHCNVYTNIEDPNYMYQLGDVLVFPRRYGGNCLPLNEALSTGMPVIMPDTSPNNHLLPKEWLVPAKVTDRFTPRTVVDVYSVDIDALREKVEWFKSCDIQAESRRADEIAQSISWEVMKPKYLEVLEALCG